MSQVRQRRPAPRNSFLPSRKTRLVVLPFRIADHMQSQDSERVGLLPINRPRDIPLHGVILGRCVSNLQFCSCCSCASASHLTSTCDSWNENSARESLTSVRLGQNIVYLHPACGHAIPTFPRVRLLRSDKQFQLVHLFRMPRCAFS